MLLWGIFLLVSLIEARTFIPISVNTLDRDYRKDEAPKSHSCTEVKAIPKSMFAEFKFPDIGLIKYTEAFGIPVVSKPDVLNDALIRACYVTAFMFADRAYSRNEFYRGRGFIHVLGYTERPHRPATKCMMTGWWKGYDNCRALPPTDEHPYVVVSEENVLCAHMWGMKDRFAMEDLLVHELAHTISRFMFKMINGFRDEAYHSLKNATHNGLWKGTYASWSVDEYVAEGTQSFFNANAHRTQYDTKHNHVHTREGLKEYDRRLYEIIRSTFPCSTKFISKCKMSKKDVMSAVSSLTLDCDPDEEIPVCVDEHSKCSEWAKQGECEFNPMFMHTKCRKSCKNCKMKTKLGCEDRYSECELWSLAGECHNNPGFMLVFCSRSCEYCVEEKHIEGCEDKDEYCKGWEILGECEKNPDYMKRNCQKSCRTCPPTALDDKKE